MKNAVIVAIIGNIDVLMLQSEEDGQQFLFGFANLSDRDHRDSKVL